MDTWTVALPETLKRFVEDQAAEAGHGSPSEYVSELIRADQRRKAEDRLDALLLEGLESGPSIPVTSEYWEEKKQSLIQRHGGAASQQ